MKKCKEVMTENPIYCLPATTASEAAALMQKEHIGSVLVVENEETKRLVGIVTDRDLAMKIVAGGLDAKSTKVEAVMTHRVITRRSSHDLQKVLNSMAKYQIRRIPIVEKDNRVVGIITQADVATRIDHPRKVALMMREVSEPKRDERTKQAAPESDDCL